MNPVIDTLLAHRSIRKFTTEPISDETLELLLRAGQAASSSSFIQAYSIIDVEEPELRLEIQACTGNQAWVGEAARFLVFCADFDRLRQVAEHQGVAPELGFTEQLLLGSVDAALVGQNVLLAAESIGLGGVFIGAIRNQPQRVAELLQLPEQVFAVFGMCLGHPDQRPGLKPRLALSQVLHKNRYNEKSFIDGMDAYDKLTSDYYRERTAGQVTSGWSEQMAEKFEAEKRPHMLKFLQDQGFARR